MAPKSRKQTRRTSVLVLLSFFAAAQAIGGDVQSSGNRFTYLDESDPFYVGLHFPKLTAPQWVGEEGVEAVVILAIDDMTETARYENFLRPILNRLKEIDGRAPVSIMTRTVCRVTSRSRNGLRKG